MRSAILLIIAAVCVLPGAVRAQDPGAAACVSIENEHDRLACYDRALSTARPAPDAAAAPAAPSTTAAPPAPSTAAAPVVAPAAAAAAVTATPTAPEARAAPPAPAWNIDPSAGQPAGVIPVVVLSTRVRPGRGVEFTTDRGDVWLQTDTTPLNLPATPFNAQLKPSTFGGVFLVPENRLGIRVRHRD